jgi:hypothetical protein
MRALLFAAIGFVCAAFGSISALAQTPSLAGAQVQQAAASVDRFKRTHAVDALDAALRSLEAAGAQRFRGDDRANVVSGYLSLFQAIDGAMPKLPPGKMPAVTVAPPRVNGVRYPSGTDPSAIHDPAARARYEQAIRDNEAFTERFLAAASLRRTDDRAVTLFADFAHDAFGKGNADRMALSRQIEHSGLTRARKDRLRSVLSVL